MRSPPLWPKLMPRRESPRQGDVAVEDFDRAVDDAFAGVHRIDAELDAEEKRLEGDLQRIRRARARLRARATTLGAGERPNDA